MSKMDKNMDVIKFKDFKLLLEAEGDDDFDFGLDEPEEGGDESPEDGGGDEAPAGGEGGEEGGGEEAEEEEVVHNDTPELILVNVFKRLKKSVEKMFETVEDAPVEDAPGAGSEVVGFNDFDKSIGKKRTEKLSFEEMGLTLGFIKINNHAKTNKRMEVRFNDDKVRYDLYIRISLDEAITDAGDKEIEPKMIKKAFITFKAWNHQSMEEVGSISRNIEDVWEIGESEDFIINLKLEIDEEFGEDDEDFKIETK